MGTDEGPAQGEGSAAIHAFLHDGTALRDVNDLVVGSGWTVQRAWSIDDDGVIAADATGSDRASHAVSLTPHVATPASETIFGDVVPPTQAADDPNSVELGVKFRSSVPGTVSSIRFFRGQANGAGYVVHLWTADGTSLASGNVVEGQCTVPCWQEVPLSPTVTIDPADVYVASYFTSDGDYAYQAEGLSEPIVSGDLTALDDAAAGGNGVYLYSPASGFPSNTYRGSNDFVDVRFTPTP